MMKTKTLLLFLLLPFALAGCGLLPAEEQKIIAYPPDAEIAGKTYADWSFEWWNWANLTGAPDGASCEKGQEYEVWFLAGAYSSGQKKRHCNVPSGKPILFPLINSFGVSPSPCEEQKDLLGKKTALENLFLTVNGANVVDDLQQYNFSMARCDDRKIALPFGYPKMPDGMRVKFSSGVYVALQPLPPGEYELKFGGASDSFSQDIIYTLVVQ